jgi:hypothetical protein
MKNPQAMRWPERTPGVRITYGAESQRLRHAVCGIVSTASIDALL